MLFRPARLVRPARPVFTFLTRHATPRLLPAPPALLFPLWDDPVCGDGVCSFPVEFPAFGSFGCIADCGLSTVPTSTVTVSITAAYRQNSVVTQSMQEAFVAATSWNLCFLSNHTNVQTQLCWFPEPRSFSSATETQTVVLNLPDADWSVRLRALANSFRSTPASN